MTTKPDPLDEIRATFPASPLEASDVRGAVMAAEPNAPALARLLVVVLFFVLEEVEQWQEAAPRAVIAAFHAGREDALESFRVLEDGLDHVERIAREEEPEAFGELPTHPRFVSMLRAVEHCVASLRTERSKVAGLEAEVANAKTALAMQRGIADRMKASAQANAERAANHLGDLDARTIVEAHAALDAAKRNAGSLPRRVASLLADLDEAKAHGARSRVAEEAVRERMTRAEERAEAVERRAVSAEADAKSLRLKREDVRDGLASLVCELASESIDIDTAHLRARSILAGLDG